MAETAKIEVTGGDVLSSIRSFLKSVLLLEDIKAVLVPQHLPMKNVVMPTLVSDPDQLEKADPLAPAFTMNSAKLVSRLSRKAMGGLLAVVLRPCEIRAFIELVKIKQGRMDELIVIGLDCAGAFKNTDYLDFAGDDGEQSTRRFLEIYKNGRREEVEGFPLAPACLACEHPLPMGADISIGLYGVETDQYLLVETRTEKGRSLTARLDLTGAEAPAQRKEMVKELLAQRILHRDRILDETHESTNSLEKLSTYLSACVNCYNCRVACPVCYCRECVFNTDVFDHEPSQYLKWANRKGIIKMPTDTVFYHLTRMTHMSHACVGCGQCSNACPNNIPVMELFRTAARKTQAAFDYEAGRSLEEEPPLSVFREDEFQEITGL